MTSMPSASTKALVGSPTAPSSVVMVYMEVPFTCLQVKSILLVPAYMQTTPSISEEELYMLRIAHLPSMALTISWGMKLMIVVGLFML